MAIHKRLTALYGVYTGCVFQEKYCTKASKCETFTVNKCIKLVNVKLVKNRPLDYVRRATNRRSFFRVKPNACDVVIKLGSVFMENVSMGGMEVWCLYTKMEILNL